MRAEDLAALGWDDFFAAQVAQESTGTALRVTELHRDRLVVDDGEHSTAIHAAELGITQPVTVGDWLWQSGDDPQAARLLERRSLLSRKAAGEVAQTQLIAANIDALFVVSSCNAEFNPARLQRYLAVALEGGMLPVIVLTKIDDCADPEAYREQAQALRPGQLVECVNATDPDTLGGLRAWCAPGQTVAMLGSSGVGKSTLANSLGADDLAIGTVRSGDGKGRHTTTARSLHRLPGGGLLIDNPGIRELQLPECESGVNALFADVLEFANCRFGDCQHDSEPGCGVRAAIAAGELDAQRLAGYRKLIEEQARNRESLAARRQRDKATGRHYSDVMARSRRFKGRDSS